MTVTTPKVRPSKGSRLAAQIGKLARDGLDWSALSTQINAFLDGHREPIIRAILPNLKPDGNGGFSVLRPSRTGKLRRIDLAGDFSTWSIDGEYRSTNFNELVGELTGNLYANEAGLILFAAAAARVLLPRDRRP